MKPVYAALAALPLLGPIAAAAEPTPGEQAVQDFTQLVQAVRTAYPDHDYAALSADALVKPPSLDGWRSGASGLVSPHGYVFTVSPASGNKARFSVDTPFWDDDICLALVTNDPGPNTETVVRSLIVDDYNGKDYKAHAGAIPLPGGRVGQDKAPRLCTAARGATWRFE